MKPGIILVGGGGHCRSCIDVIEAQGEYGIEGIIDLPGKRSGELLGYEIIGTDDDIQALCQDHEFFLVTIGQINTPDNRIRLYRIIKKAGGILPAIISPLAHVSKHAEIGEGTVIMHGSIVNAGAQIGENCIINTKALIEHDAIIGDHCHISTGAVINGGTIVGKGTFFGSCSVSREYIKIGRNSVIGFNLKVSRDLPEGSHLK